MLGAPALRANFGETTSDNQTVGTTTSQINAGDYIVAVAVSDGDAVDGETNIHTGLTVGSVVLTKRREMQEGGASAATSVVVSMWYGVAPSNIANGSNVTLDLNAARADKRITVISGTRDITKSFVPADGISLDADNYVSASNNDMRAQSTSGMTSEEHLHISAWGCDATPTTFTATATWTRVSTTGQVTGTNATRIEYKISTSVGETSDPSSNAGNSTEWACILAAFREIVSGPTTYFGATSLPITFSKAVAGSRKTFGQLVRSFTFAATIDGKRKTFGQFAFPIIFLKETQAQRKTFGQLLSPFIFGTVVAGYKTTFGQTVFPINVGIATAGIRLGITHYGVVALPVIFGKEIQGQRKAFGQIAFPMTFGKDVQAQRQTFSQIIFPITFIKEAVGRKNVFGQLSMQTLFGKEIAGRRKTFSQLAMPIIFSKAVVGSKQTFGKVDLPISVPIFVDGYGWVGPKTYYGQLEMPIAFDKQVVAYRRTFGQINAPLLFGSTSQGQRQTFSELEFPIDFETEVKSGPVGVHGIVDLDLVLTIDTAGKIVIFGVILNEADAIYLGNQNISAVYLGSEQVWPT